MKIKHKLSALLSLLLLVSTTAVIVLALSWASENFKQNALNDIRSALELSSQQLKSELSVVNQSLDIYIHSREVQSGDPSIFLPYLQGEIKRQQPHFEKFIYGLPNGTFYNTAGGNPHLGMLRSFDDDNAKAPPYNIAQRDYWQATIAQNSAALPVTFVSQPMISYTTGKRQVVVASAIVAEGSVIGLLGVSLYWRDIEASLERLKANYFSRFDWPARLMLTDREGNYWYHWNPEKVVQKLADENGQSVLDNSGQPMSLISNIKDEHISELTEVYSGNLKSGVNVVRFRTQQDKPGLYFIYEIIPHSDYVLGLIVSRDELLGPLTQLQQKYAWLLGIIVICAWVAAIFIAHLISAPLERLTHAVNALSKGKMLPIASNHHLDEIRLLSQAFENIRHKFIERESDLATSESRFEYAMQGANDGLWDWNLANDEVFYSPRWITMLGYEPEGFGTSTSKFFQVIHRDDKKKVIHKADAYLSGKIDKFRMTLRLKHKDGHYVDVLSRAFAVRDPSSGKTIRLVGTHVDISEQVAFEAKIKGLNEDLEKRVVSRTEDLMLAKEAALKAQAAAEEANLAKSRFLANMSHELRTPLNSINGFADRLITRLEGVIEPRHMDALKTIARNGRQLLHIINDILDTQGIDSGDITLKYSLVLVPELFDQLARSYKDKADEKGIALHFKYPDDIDHRSIYADPIRIRQILDNLLNNAVKFTDQGSVSISALVANHQHKPGMRFDIQDTGRGIEIPILDSLFMPFTQADNSVNRLISGTGLGLTLVKLLTEMHNGAVTVQSELGKGSTFSVWIPDQKP